MMVVRRCRVGGGAVDPYLPESWPSQYTSWVQNAHALLAAKDWSAAFKTYPWLTFADSPWAVLNKPLSNACIAVIGSGGLTTDGQIPFDASNVHGDGSFRVVATHAPLERWRIDHDHYDHEAALCDYNSVLPIDVMRGLAADGVIGTLAPRSISFMGYQTDADAWLRTSAPAIHSLLAADAVDAALLVPV